MVFYLFKCRSVKFITKAPSALKILMDLCYVFSSNWPRNQIWSRLDSDESDKRLAAVVSDVVVVVVVAAAVVVDDVVDVVVTGGSKSCSL